MHELSVHIIDSSIIIVIMIIMIIITIIILFFSWISYFYHFLASKTILLFTSLVLLFFLHSRTNPVIYINIIASPTDTSLSLLPCSSIMYSLLNRYLSLIKYLGHILRHPVQNLEPSPLPFGVLPLVTRNRTLDFPPIPSIGYL